MADDKLVREPSLVHPSMRGGPKGYGDPDSRYLRKVEKEVTIPSLMKKITHEEKCPEEVKVFSACAKKEGLSVWYKCRSECNVMKECLAKWYQDKEFMDEVTEIYLKQRAEYRRTGVGKSMKRKESTML